MRRLFPAMQLLVAVLAVGCSLIPGADFVPGSTTQSAVRASLGAPGKTYPAPGGGVIWAYPTGPMGEQTWMARFDDKGTLIKFEQVLDQEHFWGIRPGMDGAQVGAILGPPSSEMRFDRLRQVSWDYRYQDVWGYVSEYSVIFGEEGKVVGTFNRRLYPGKDRY
jgi:hypothetical protein